MDKENEKISLGIKQMEPDPWATIDQKYPINSIVGGKVRNLTAFGAFVELEEGIDGLVHISDMSWTKRVQHPSEIMKKGDKVDVKILKIDHENRRISLGVKQLYDDPWPEISKKHAVGSECLGTVTKVMDRGVVVELDGNVEGFVPTSQLGSKDINDPTGVFKEGEQIPLKVIEFDRNQHKIVLSVGAYYKSRESNELDEFLTKHPAETTTTMADAMPEELKAQAPEETPAPAEVPAVEETPAEAAPAAEEEAPEAEKPTEQDAPAESSEESEEDK